MDPIDKDCLKQIDNLLGSNQQSWLFGAGISKGANIPLMDALTYRIFSIADRDDKKAKKTLDAIKAQLPERAHIEHILSHLGDYAAMAERSRDQKAHIGADDLSLHDLQELHGKILRWIADTIRWGYIQLVGENPERIGTREGSLVSIDAHLQFVSALFHRNQAGLIDRRSAVRFFTINYDTLLEDALSLSSLSHWDGFAGGAVAYRSYRYGQDVPETAYRAHIVKLHGSIDWHLSDDDRLYRIREGDNYPKSSSPVLIYPQSTKYLATQRDPFSSQFDLFRRALASPTENVLSICGYSFGDEHINQEIELALHRGENRTTILAFSPSIGDVLKKWQKLPWANRLYVISEPGIFVGPSGPFFPPPEGTKRDWWTFAGVTRILTAGAESFVV
jgi:hypothetical protein